MSGGKYEKVVYFAGVGADTNEAGWYVVYFDGDNNQYADVGPFDTEYQAKLSLGRVNPQDDSSGPAR